jgi:hypothetical protein
VAWRPASEGQGLLRTAGGRDVKRGGQMPVTNLREFVEAVLVWMGEEILARRSASGMTG